MIMQSLFGGGLPNFKPNTEVKKGANPVAFRGGGSDKAMIQFREIFN